MVQDELNHVVAIRMFLLGGVLRAFKRILIVKSRLIRNVLIVLVVISTLLGVPSAIPMIRLYVQRQEVEQRVAKELRAGLSRTEAEAAMDRLDYTVNYHGSDNAKKSGYSMLEPRRFILILVGEHQVVLHIEFENERVARWEVTVEPNK